MALPKLLFPTIQRPQQLRETHAHAAPQVYDVDDVDKIQGPPSGKEILEQIDINGDNEVTIDEFSDLMESHMYATRRTLALTLALALTSLAQRHS